MELDRLLEFCRLLLQFQAVERVVGIPGREQDENDAEHSYALAMAGWYLVQTLELDLNIDRVIRYGLIHDIVEVYAGDTFAFDTDQRAHQTKRQREELALHQLQQELPHFGDLTDQIEQYEQLADPESRFIYALDKLMPELVIYLGDGSSWHRDGITEALLATKEPKLTTDPVVYRLWQQLHERLREQPQLFPAPDTKKDA